ncbi:TIR domain-containing protein [candidate division KSB1 bacterium]|nr:TIR domain-containing protein [candidate division KSB1 bacterium]
MPKVFISHTWEDNAISRKIAENLKNNGADIWIDYARIEGGGNLPIVVSNAIKSCDTLILIWSESASTSYWVEEEWSCAHALRKRIIPCLLSNTELPAILLSRLHIDFTDYEAGYNALLRALNLVKKNVVTKRDNTRSDVEKERIVKPTIIKTFRNTPLELSESDVKTMLTLNDFYCKESSWSKDYCNPDGKGFPHHYQVSKDKLTVLDASSGLLWQRSGSDEYMKLDKAEKYIDTLNSENFAGYHDWRLPTLEEAMSLMEPEEKNGNLCIDPVFDKTQIWIWTSDQLKGNERRRWDVIFTTGDCGSSVVLNDYGYVRAVRSR